jgi:hypothetical protein
MERRWQIFHYRRASMPLPFVFLFLGVIRELTPTKADAFIGTTLNAVGFDAIYVQFCAL